MGEVETRSVWICGTVAILRRVVARLMVMGVVGVEGMGAVLCRVVVVKADAMCAIVAMLQVLLGHENENKNENKVGEGGHQVFDQRRIYRCHSSHCSIASRAPEGFRALARSVRSSDCLDLAHYALAVRPPSPI